MDQERVTWKITVLGQPDAGKSSLISRIVYDSDSGVIKQRGLIKKKMTLEKEGRKVIADLLFLELKDEEGVEKLLTGSNCVLVAVDITKNEELEVAADIVRYLYSFEESPLVILIGTKSDLRYEAVVWEKDFDRVRQDLGVDYFLVSAKTADSISELVDHMAEKLLERFYAKRKANA